MLTDKRELSWDNLLLPKQTKIYQELLRINKKAANAYKGALVVLRGRENPDRFSQAAHSLRELTALICREISIPQETKKDDDEGLRKKLEKKFAEDPDLLPSPSEKKVRELIRSWCNLHNDFFIPVAHHGKATSDEEFLSKLSEFEEILLQFLNPAPVALKELDSLLTLPSPNLKDIEKLSELLKHPTHSEYFFSRLSSPDWLIPLKEHGFFDNPPSGIKEGNYVVFPSWPLSKYLIRISKERPREVMDIIKSLQDTDNFRVHVDLIECVLQMPSAIAKETVPLAKKWIDTPYLTAIPQKLGELVIKFSNENEIESALTLLNTLLNIKDVKKYAVGNIEFREVQPYLDLWNYEEILSKIVPVVVKRAPNKVVEMLCSKLNEAITLEATSENLNDDFSYIWRPAIENHQQITNRDIKNLLTTAIRDCLETIGKNNGKLFKKCYKLLSKYRYPIFKRLELHLMRIFPEALQGEIQKALSDKEIFSDIHLWHEYYHLLQEQYPKLPQNVKKCILQWIEEGPDLEKLVFWYKSENKRMPAQEEKNAYKSRWQMKYLSAIKDYVPSEWIEKWRALVAKYGTKYEKHVYFDFNSFKVEWIEESSPLTKEEIEKMSIHEIVNYLKEWKPSGHYLEPSREGLGTILSEVVSENPEKFIELLQEAKNLHPIYVYYLLEGFRKAFEGKKVFDLKSVISACRDLVLSITNSFDDENWWGMVKTALGNFVETGLKNSDILFPYELRGTIWEIIETLLQDREPDLYYEKEYSGDNMDPVTLSLTTVRGKAMHALIQYALWCVQCLNLSENEDKMTSEVKKWLEKMLNPNIEPTETIRSVYGLYLSNLFYLNRCWVEKHLHDIFPEDGEHRNLWRAAWEAYIIYSNFSCSIYKMLRTQYKAAVNKLNSPKISQIAKEKLLEHLIIAYLLGLENISNDSLVRSLFQKAQPEIRKHVIWFVGSVLKDFHELRFSLKEKREIINRIKKLWEWRIEEIRKLKEKERREHVHELEWFGMWFIHGSFDKSWMISQLLNTLELTEGKIEFASDIVDNLLPYVKDYYPYVLKVLSLLIKAKGQGIFMITSEEKVKKLLSVIIKSCPCDEIKDKVNEIIDSLVRKGYYEFAGFFISENNENP